MMTRVYTCNICSEGKEPKDMYGIRWGDIDVFVIDEAQSTDGFHICVGCMSNLKEQIESKGI